MKKAFIAAIIVLAAGGAFWAFAASGNGQPRALSEQEKSVLKTKNPKLTMGDENASVTIVEYADVMCPYCAKFSQKVLPRVKSDYIKTGKVYYEVRLVAVIADDSRRAAEGAYCASEQNMFWDYLDTAYTATWNSYYSQGEKPEDVPLFAPGHIQAFAARIGLDTIAWKACLESDKYLETIRANQAAMRRMGARGTPHFVINGKHYSGAPPYPVVKAVIESALHKAKQ